MRNHLLSGIVLLVGFVADGRDNRTLGPLHGRASFLFLSGIRNGLPRWKAGLALLSPGGDGLGGGFGGVIDGNHNAPCDLYLAHRHYLLSSRLELFGIIDDAPNFVNTQIVDNYRHFEISYYSICFIDSPILPSSSARIIFARTKSPSFTTSSTFFT